MDMVQQQITGADIREPGSIWENDEKLKNLSRIERNLISAFPWVLGLVLMGIAVYSPTTEIWIASVCASAMLVLAPLLYLLRMSIKLIIHLTLSVCCICAIYIASQTGGAMSMQLAWLLFVPMMPLRLISFKAGVAWTLICLIIFIGMGWLDASYWAFAMPEMSDDMIKWSVLQKIMLCLGMLILPLFYTKSYQHAITVMRQHNKVIRQKKAELVRAQNNKQKFIARLSHEMRTPMNAVVGFSHLLHMESDKHPEAAAVIAQIEITAQHLLGIINGIMDYTQLIDGKLNLKRERVQSENLVRSSFNVYAQRAQAMQVAYQCQIDRSVPNWIEVDEARTRQVLMSLLEHALDRTAKGLVQLRVKFADQQLIFTVEDSGPSLSADVAQQLTAVQSVNPQTDMNSLDRTNLKLFMANALTQLMGGHLQIKKGTSGVCIAMHLPQTSTTEAVEPMSPPPAGEPLDPMFKALPLAVLVVDDNPVNRLLVEQVIRTHWPTAHVVQASNGKNALTALNQQLFDIVLMDMLMPEMDGIVATKLLRQNLASQNQAIPVLGLTANISSDDHLRCLQAGMNDIVLKPFDRDKLIQHIAQLLLASADFRSKNPQHIQAQA